MASEEWRRQRRRRGAVRAALQRVVDSGEAVCLRCGRAVLPGQAWDVDHAASQALGGDVWDSGNHFVSHSRCNRAAGARLAAKMRAVPRRQQPSPVAAPGFELPPAVVPDPQPPRWYCW